MKRIFQSLTLLALFVIIPFAQAAEPTVTVTEVTYGRQKIYTFSYTTAIGTVDTAIVGNAAGNFITVDGVGSHPSDSLIVIELKSSEGTADSIRHTVWVQFSSATTPTMAVALGATGVDWHASVSDATTFTNTANGAAIKVAKVRLTGNSTKMRILVGENDANKDAVQTVTGRIIVPTK